MREKGAYYRNFVLKSIQSHRRLTTQRTLVQRRGRASQQHELVQLHKVRWLKIKLGAVGIHLRRFALVDIPTRLGFQHVEFRLNRLAVLRGIRHIL